MLGLLDLLKKHKAKRVLFHYEGRAIQSGYHITEVKNGSFVALDCGANPESWSELFVQLLDVAGDGRHMAAGKFSAIIDKVAGYFALDGAAKLIFEVSNGIEPIRLFMAASLTVATDEVHIELVPRPASCKPRERWLAQEEAASAGCCGGARASPADACCS